MATCETNPPGVVESDSLYTLAEIQARLKMGQSAMREARRKGLTVLRCGRRGYIRGCDVIAFLAETGRK